MAVCQRRDGQSIYLTTPGDLHELGITEDHGDSWDSSWPNASNRTVAWNICGMLKSIVTLVLHGQVLELKKGIVDSANTQNWWKYHHLSQWHLPATAWQEKWLKLESWRRSWQSEGAKDADISLNIIQYPYIYIYPYIIHMISIWYPYASKSKFPSLNMTLWRSMVPLRSFPQCLWAASLSLLPWMTSMWVSRRNPPFP